jgi:hypothetical protein
MTRLVAFIAFPLLAFLFMVGCAHSEFRQERLRDQLDLRLRAGQEVRTAMDNDGFAKSARRS